ncbi:OLC1v1025791C2 [Oldenlandia corymbosa var. corymbosa]|uniref:non-specific serine/threonine protein kinase n=1 Tax=Oldenlandia corymbosa var. corymbosa TaxID=529605 RepID=A0AAV1C641_OLDCO|nr:OLC1v1025791C2 [Oldenlandia corymbosa var. corymbosa]
MVFFLPVNFRTQNMMSNIIPKLIMLLLVPLLCVFTVCLAMTTRNITTDEVALLALKSSITDLPSHHILAHNWTVIGSSVCDWIGVTCGSRHRRVTALDLSEMNLGGTVPPHLGNLSFLVSLNLRANNFHGELPQELSLLRRLKSLNLGDNSFSEQFPSWIGSLQSLEYLSLWNNSFTGVIPPSISNMSALSTLSLSHNDLQGNIPTVIFNMSSLQRIALSYIGFSAGSLPDDMCQHLPRLVHVDFGHVGLIGRIPSSIGLCSQLRRLYLPFNSLTGEIPKQISNLKWLQVLALTMNMLEGTIPKEIGNMSMLQEVYLDQNNLTGIIPEEISKLSNVQIIVAQVNKLTGSIPVDIFNISTIRIIAFGVNNLSGNLPSTMCYTLPNLQGIYVSTNSISGVIPKSISNCSNIQVLELAKNNFTGLIPNSLGDLSLLQGLHLHDNNLMSDHSSPVLNFITSVVGLKHVVEINLGNNPLDGILPYWYRNLSSTLVRIYAYNCNIRGTIPSWVGNLSSLSTLSLHYNHLIGSLPNSIENMQNLQIMDLLRNKINISLQLFCPSKKLGFLDLKHNLINEGAIPYCFGNITSMRYLLLSSSGLSSNLPASIWNLKDLLELNLSSNSLTGFLPLEINQLKNAYMMDFSNNSISGDIPSTIGDLESMQSLFLAHNQLQGQIPETFGKLLSLKELDLSYNSLSGFLPMSLENLQDLSFLNVSFNNLSGKIPPGGPFTNLTAKSFISNHELCGEERFHVPLCPNLSTDHHGISNRRMHKIVIVLVVAILVGMISLWFIWLKCKRKDRGTNNDHEDVSLVTWKRISYYELLRATDGYSQDNLLGSGSFGSVYKGTLQDGEIVAIKVFNLQLERSFKSFDKECEILRNLRHRNLTKVISGCSTPDFKALVLEYMPNGSLDKCLHSKNKVLNLTQRLDILIDVTCALLYLHKGNSTPVVHCDLKPSNVLLDQEKVAKISDFGISKLLGLENSITYTDTLATLCYAAPGKVFFNFLFFLFLFIKLHFSTFCFY